MNYHTQIFYQMKKITLLALFLINFINAQTPANDTCSGAITIGVDSNSCQNPVIYDNTGSTDSGLGNPVCAGTAGGDLWYKTLVPASGFFTVQTSGVSGSNLTDTGIAVYTGDCSNLTKIGCSDDAPGLGAFSKVELVNLTPGTMLYIRVFFVYQGVTGQFQLCAYDPQASGISNYNLNNFTISPNPAHNIIQLSADKNINQVGIYNLTGQQVISLYPERMSLSVDLSNLNNGIYFVKAIINDETTTYKLIKE